MKWVTVSVGSLDGFSVGLSVGSIDGMNVGYLFGWWLGSILESLLRLLVGVDAGSRVDEVRYNIGFVVGCL